MNQCSTSGKFDLERDIADIENKYFALPPKTQIIKTKFINQVLDLFNISAIFRDHRVASKIPQYF